MFGAGFGALAAHFIASRSRTQEQILHELRSTNSAIMLTSNVCQMYLNLKGQHVAKLVAIYNAHTAAFAAHQAGQRQGTIPENEALHFEIDLRFIPNVLPAIEPLQKLIYENTSLSGHALHLVPELASAIHQQRTVNDTRSQYLNSLRPRLAEDSFRTVMYFGLSIGGETDKSYPSLVRGIGVTTDDCIFFSDALCKQLTRHGRILLRRFRGKFAVHSVDFPDAVKAGLMPDPKNYESWLKALELR